LILDTQLVEANLAKLRQDVALEGASELLAQRMAFVSSAFGLSTFNELREGCNTSGPIVETVDAGENNLPFGARRGVLSFHVCSRE